MPFSPGLTRIYHRSEASLDVYTPVQNGKNVSFPMPHSDRRPPLAGSAMNETGQNKSFAPDFVGF